MGKLVAVGVWIAVALVGCLPDDDKAEGPKGPPPECTTDAECTHLDTDTDVCTVVKCEAQKCVPRVQKNSTECQCATNEDCIAVLGNGNSAPKDCSTTLCTDHKCSSKIEPAGPAPRQTDCAKVTCDGVTADGKKEGSPDGTDCATGVCFGGKCLACKAQNPTSCAAEGPNEPANNTGATAAAYSQQQPVCGFSGGDDIDWYTFFAEDGDFSNDVIRFRFWTSAPTIEACLYVKCQSNGTPEGGCADLKDGPNGSRGCCYTGAPAAVLPVWDLDCTGSSDDSGTVYLSVRTPGANTCERYTMSGGY